MDSLFGMALVWSNFMATVAGPGIGFEAHSRQGSGGEDNYGIQWFSNVPSQKWTVWAQKIVVLKDELPFEKAQGCRCHVSFRGYATSFGGRNYHSNRFKWMISFHVSRPTWWPWINESLNTHCLHNDMKWRGSWWQLHWFPFLMGLLTACHRGQPRAGFVGLQSRRWRCCPYTWMMMFSSRCGVFHGTFAWGWKLVGIASRSTAPSTNDVKVCKSVEFIW